MVLMFNAPGDYLHRQGRWGATILEKACKVLSMAPDSVVTTLFNPRVNGSRDEVHSQECTRECEGSPAPRRRVGSRLCDCWFQCPALLKSEETRIRLVSLFSPGKCLPFFWPRGSTSREGGAGLPGGVCPASVGTSSFRPS